MYLSGYDWASRNEHLHVVKWLHENRTEGCTTWALNYDHRYAHLEIKEWLLENRTEVCNNWLYFPHGEIFRMMEDHTLRNM
jgi:hypothetical protein